MNRKNRAHLRLGLVLAIAACATGKGKKSEQEKEEANAGPPATEARPVVDEHHGVKVTDPYRWLESWDDPKVRAWSDAQNRYARSVLDRLPGGDAIRARVGEIFRAESILYFRLQNRGDLLFAEQRHPPKQQPLLVVMPSTASGAERVLLDPNVLDPSGGTAIDWFKPSPDGALVAVSLSKAGTESGDLTIYRTADGQRVHEVVPRVNGGTAGGDLAWAADGKGFYYTRYPREGERPALDLNFYVQVYFHALGTSPEKDRYEIGKDFPRIAEIALDLDRKSGRILATVQNGDGGEFEHHLRSPKGGWRRLSTFSDRTLTAVFGPSDDLYLLSRKDAPRGKIVRVPIAAPDAAKGKVVVPEGDASIVQDFWGAPTVLPTRTRLYVLYQLGGPSAIRAFDLDGKPLDAPEQLPVSAAGGMTPVGKDDILFSNESFVVAPAWYRFSAAAGETKKTALVTQAPVDLSQVEVRREFATSKDGTKIPVNVLIPPGAALDGSSPAVLYGYGGYGVNIEPRFIPRVAVFLEQGVVYAVANIRGGGEFGESWHREGNLTRKQNVFDDFKAAIDLLVARRYTSPPRLGILGGSNGGLLMGAMLTQHPADVRAVVSFVGIYDMLRVELSPNGAFNVTEFGTVKDPEQFRALYAYSPYHHVRDGTRYPATLLLTGANDPRVDPMQSRKMAARLQAASRSGQPILLRTSADSGHGGSTPLDEQIAQYADVFAFFFHQLGVEVRKR
jgi:prolyl oligopeptidase